MVEWLAPFSEFDCNYSILSDTRYVGMTTFTQGVWCGVELAKQEQWHHKGKELFHLPRELGGSLCCRLGEVKV